jgi:hypothetical protein
MFDEMERLCGVKGLCELLAYYVERGAEDRQAWQDRPEEMEGVSGRELVRLHGELLAHGWIEQNTGLTPVLKAGAAPCCYRITTAGIRALKQASAAHPG